MAVFYTASLFLWRIQVVGDYDVWFTWLARVTCKQLKSSFRGILLVGGSMKSLQAYATGFLVCLSMPAFSADPAGSFKVSGDVQSETTWNAALIKQDLKADIQLVHYELKGQKHTANCVPILSVINASHPAVNSRIKHHDLQFTVSVQGFDGYAVAFSMAELLPEIGNRKVWIALDEDGKAPTEEGGALQVIVPDDVKPARWVHSITAITITDGAKPPAHG